jgi:hypothetical protein
LVDFVGKAKSEARGIVDMIAIRKDHRHNGPDFKGGDRFEIVLIQSKVFLRRDPRRAILFASQASPNITGRRLSYWQSGGSARNPICSSSMEQTGNRSQRIKSLVDRRVKEGSEQILQPPAEVHR